MLAAFLALAIVSVALRVDVAAALGLFVSSLARPKGQVFPELASNFLGLVSFVAVLVLLSALTLKDRD